MPLNLFVARSMRREEEKVEGTETERIKWRILLQILFI